MLERRIRLWTGLALAVYVVLHLLTHSLGAVSVDAAVWLQQQLSVFWRSAPGSVLLYGSLTTHFVLGLKSLVRRTTLKLPRWELMQIGLGISLLPLVWVHIVATRGTLSFSLGELQYMAVLHAIWSDPLNLIKQVIALLVVWGHLCIGLHFWLRMKAWYLRAQPLVFVLATALPLLSLVALVRNGLDPGPFIPADFSWRAGTWSFADISNMGYGVMFASMLIVLMVHAIRYWQRRQRPGFVLRHSAGFEIKAYQGQTVLEALRQAQIPHASVCGGRARCTTCRIRVNDGLQNLPPPNPIEARALQLIAAEPLIRLACQTRPTADLNVTPLLPAVHSSTSVAQSGGMRGVEREVVALFVDLRDSTKLAEQKLPYDVLFVLNQFFAHMSAALQDTHGHYAQFNGDGLLALYGLNSSIGDACKAALQGAVQMQKRIEQLNTHLASELISPLQIGIGIHCGPAIVGSMGPPSAPIISAIGDSINIAARLEAKTKDYECILVVSQAVVSHAGVNERDFDCYQAALRGRADDLKVYAIHNLEALQRNMPV